MKTGVNMLHVPYKGSAEAMNDLLAGRIDVIYDSVALPQIKAGRLKALAVTGTERHPELPDVPTLHEQDLDRRCRAGLRSMRRALRRRRRSSAMPRRPDG